MGTILMSAAMNPQWHSVHRQSQFLDESMPLQRSTHRAPPAGTVVRNGRGAMDARAMLHEMGTLLERRTTELAFVGTEPKMAVIDMSAQSVCEIEHFAAVVAFLCANLLMQGDNVLLQIGPFRETALADFTLECLHFGMHNASVFVQCRDLAELPPALLARHGVALLAAFFDASWYRESFSC